MSSNARFVTGEPFAVRDSKTLVDRVLDGPDVYQRTATDLRGNSAEAAGTTPQEATDKAILKVMQRRSED